MKAQNTLEICELSQNQRITLDFIECVCIRICGCVYACVLFELTKEKRSQPIELALFGNVSYQDYIETIDNNLGNLHGINGMSTITQ